MAQSPAASGAPLGLYTLAITTFIVGAVFAGLIPGGALLAVGGGTVIIGLAFFYGGIVELIAAIQEFRAGSTLTGTIFGSYAGFYLSFGYILLQLLPVKAVPVPFLALGYFLLAWTVFTFLMLLSALKTNIALILFFLLLLLTFVFLTLPLLGAGPESFLKIGGYFAIATAVVAAYTALALTIGLPAGARK